MKLFWKKVLIGGLSFSNLLVLSLIFRTYFESHQRMLLFSKSGSSKALIEKIKQECEDDVKNLAEGKRQKITCGMTVNRSHQGVSYGVAMAIRVTAIEQGKYKVTNRGSRIVDATKHVKEADLCEKCSMEQEFEGGIEDIMDRVLSMAKKVYDETHNQVVKAYNKRADKARKAKHCEGHFDKETGEFKGFDKAEKISCIKMRVSNTNSVEAEAYYHNELKKGLWKLAISDDSDLLHQVLPIFSDNDSYKYLLSVKDSIALMSNYLIWKGSYELLETEEGQKVFVKAIQQKIKFRIIANMTEQQSQDDKHFLNKAFDRHLAPYFSSYRYQTRTPAQINPPQLKE